MEIDQMQDIRPICQADLEMVLEWRNHPSIRKHMLMQHEISRQEHEEWFLHLQSNANTQVFIIESSKVPIGIAQFKNIVPLSDANWGFYLAPNAPKGSGTLLGQTALAYAFGPLNLQKVCGQVLSTNAASIRFHEKLGFQHEGTQNNLICFGLTKDSWTLHSTATH